MTRRRYLSLKVTAIQDVRPTIWNSSDPGRDGNADRVIILEQYKLYVEMADRISARRSLANTFFLTFNTVIFAVIGALWKDRPLIMAWLLVFPLVTLVVQCGAWFFIVRSYRQLSSAKYSVIGVLEERLPASPYWKGEWKALGEGKDKAKYWPMTQLEMWIPLIFAATYIIGFIVAVTS